MIHISAAMLVKSSMKALVYKELNKVPTEATPGILKGREWEDKVSDPRAFREMRGSVYTDDYALHFSWDNVREDTKHIMCTEIKQIRNYPPKAWYAWNGFIQVALYAGLTFDVDELVTATFAKERYGEKKVNLKQPKPLVFRFLFQEHYFEVQPSFEIVGFYHGKAKTYAKAITAGDPQRSYDIADQWDEKYKHKDWKLLKQYLVYEEL